MSERKPSWAERTWRLALALLALAVVVNLVCALIVPVLPFLLLGAVAGVVVYGLRRQQEW